MRHFIRFILVFCLIQFSYAESIEAKKFDNNSQEMRYRALIDEIRCPVCQGQSIGGSNAALAKDLREKVREMVVSSKSDDDIRKFMTDRYGDFVVFKPPVNTATYILWFAPFIFLIIGVVFLFKSVKNKKNIKTNNIDTSKADKLLK